MQRINKKFSKKLFAVIMMPGVIFAQVGMSWMVGDAKANKDVAFSETAGDLKSTSGDADNSAVSQKPEYVPGEVIVKFKSERINLRSVAGEKRANTFAEDKSLDKKEDLEKANISVLKINDAKTVEEKVAELKNDPNVEYAQPNFQYHLLAIDTNDTYKNSLWGLDNTGQTVNGVSGTADADVDAPEAWAVGGGANASVTVAIIDTGVAYNHPDLINDMWDGAACKDENGASLRDCNHGYDFEDEDKTPLPTTSSHGTHVAGTIAAEKNNGAGIVGVAPQAKIMALKTSLATDEIVKSIGFAEQNGAKIINASWGGGATNCAAATDQALYNAIDNFNGLFVAAAGNSAENHNGSSYFDFPADYGHATSCWSGLDNVISVAATNQTDALAPFSDYGANYIDVGAPGVNICSTVSGSTASGSADITGTTAYNETFETVTAPSLPNGWIGGGTTSNGWGTYDLGGNWGKVLYGDLNYPYANDANTYVTSPAYNLGSTREASVGFWARCDTEYSPWADYMALEYSNDNFATSAEIAKWDEPYLDELNSDSNQSGSANYYLSYNIPNQYLTDDFKFRFRWKTNSSVNNFDGCLVDDVKITTYADVDGSAGEYSYYSGTSMATPHVVGLAALIMGYKPALTYVQVKDVILNTGDSLPALAGKTVTGKRINAFNALFSLRSDTVAPILREITSVPAISEDTTPDYIFSSDEAGAVTYSGSCGNGSISQAIAGANTASFTLSAGTYSNCAIVVTDNMGNVSASLSIPSFTISPATTLGKSILFFGFGQSVGVISETEHTIRLTVPYGTDITALSPTITLSTGATVLPASGSAQNFTTSQIYTVTAGDSTSSQSYAANVVVSPNPDITSVAADKEALTESLILGTNTGLSNITAGLANPLPSSGSNGSVISWASNLPQVVSNNGSVTRPAFAAGDVEVVLTATLTKGIITDTKSFTLTVKEALNPAKDILSFNFASLSPQVIGSISGTNISLTVPYGTAITALVPTITISEGATTSPASGVAQNFTTSQAYTVTAADSSTKIYTVTVTISASSGGGGSGGSGGGGAPVVPVVTSVSAANKPLQVKPSQEGTLKWSLTGQNEIKVSIPKGSVTSATTFSVEKGSLSENYTPENETDSSLFSDLIFDINAVDGNSAAVKKFNQDLTVLLTVPELLENTSGLKLYYFDETNKKWSQIENVIFGAGAITFKVNHLTKFAVFKTEQTSSSESPTVVANVASATVSVSDGDIVQSKSSSNPFAVYIVKIANGKKYIRHIVSLEIFNHYKHLKWENLKQLDSLEGFSLSGWVRVNTGSNGTAGAGDKIYEINGDQTKHWINMTAEQFLTHGGSENAVYSINQGEADLYANGADVLSL